MGTPRLVTERLALYDITPADVDLLTELNADPEVMRFLDRSPTPRQVIAAEVAAVMAEYLRTPGYGRWIVRGRAGEEFLGWVALRVSDGADHATLGYRLARAAWGHGYAREAGRALLDYGFGRGLARISADTMAVNSRSRRVMSGLGMRHVRSYHEHFDDPLPGTEHGEVEYQITRSEWEAAKLEASRVC